MLQKPAAISPVKAPSQFSCSPSSSSSPPSCHHSCPSTFHSPSKSNSPGLTSPSAATLPPPPVVITPCAACKILRRRCVDKCVLAPYFPPSEPYKFTIAHRVFGASNIIKFLQVTIRHSLVPSVFFHGTSILPPWCLSLRDLNIKRRLFLCLFNLLLLHLRQNCINTKQYLQFGLKQFYQKLIFPEIVRAFFNGN
jgi:hypothetical protein